MLIDAGGQLYAEPPIPLKWHREKKQVEELEQRLRSQNGPDYDAAEDELLARQRAILEHNRPKSAMYWLEHSEAGRSIAKELIDYAAQKGQRPSS